MRGTWLEMQGLLFSAYDEDTFFDDPYIAPLEVKVDDLVKYGSRTYRDLPMEALLGTQAYLTFTARVERVRRLSNDDSQGVSQIGHARIEQEMQEPGPRRTSSRCNAGKVDVALGVHGYFGGLFIPYDWSGKSKPLKLVDESDFESQVFYGPNEIYCRTSTTTTTTTPQSLTAPPPELAATTTTTTRGRFTQKGCQCLGLRSQC